MGMRIGPVRHAGPVEREPARTTGDNLKQPAGHGDVPYEMDELDLIPKRRMETGGGDEGEHPEHGGSRASTKAADQREAAERLGRDRPGG